MTCRERIDRHVAGLPVDRLATAAQLQTGTPEDVRREIEHYLEATEGRLFLLSTNTINPDAKMESIRAAFDYAREHPLAAGSTGG